MIKTLSTVILNSVNPYENLALEEALFYHVKEDECILYLWQNQHTVVIGKNQNAYQECHINKLKEENGHIARRLSGGGAVYHDLGNLNFTFLVHKKYYDVKKQLEVIQVALKKYGIIAELTGRNDLCVDGYKISGNAFLNIKERCLHHGTLLMDVDVSKMAKYLNPSKLKLKSKAVSSVKARVKNLIEFNDLLNKEQLCTYLIEAFNAVYQLESNPILVDQLEINLKKYEDKTFILGTNSSYEFTITDRFDWGEIQLFINIKNHTINEYKVYSDTLKMDFIEKLQLCLQGVVFCKPEIIDAIKNIQVLKEEEKIKQDCIELFEREDF